MAMPLIRTSGWPLEVTRVVPRIHCAVTQGGMEAAGMPGQPATVQGAEITAEGMPLSVTRGLGAVGIAWPPCMQSTVAPCCMRKPGMSDDLHCALVDGDGRAD